jgi:AsmA protein
MARHFRRRLTHWFLAGIAALALLVLVALAALWWFFDPDDYRAQIESRASAAIGRPVRLTGALSWQLGRRISIVSEGGEIANAAGFGPGPLARWSRIRLGVAARPLFDRRVLIDHIDVHGLQLLLQRDAVGSVNWKLQGTGGDEKSAAQSVVVRIAGAAVHDGAVHYVDAGAGADWHVTALEARARLPEDFMAVEREFRDVALSGRVAGGPLAEEGVAFEFQSAVFRLSPQQLQVPAFTARWADSRLDGGMALRPGVPDIEAKLNLQAPSLRALLATAGVKPPAMRDATTLGALHLELSLRYAAGAATVDDLSMKLDGTHVTGKVELPKLQPLAMRFNLAADRVDLDRYLEPVDAKSEPLELPLAWLKQLDARGTLRIRQATVAGAAAKELRIDVE